MRLPVYLLVTKADLVAGFEPFFGDFNEKEREQVWGHTFDHQPGRTEAPEPAELRDALDGARRAAGPPRPRTARGRAGRRAPRAHLRLPRPGRRACRGDRPLRRALLPPHDLRARSVAARRVPHERHADRHPDRPPDGGRRAEHRRRCRRPRPRSAGTAASFCGACWSRSSSARRALPGATSPASAATGSCAAPPSRRSRSSASAPSPPGAGASTGTATANCGSRASCKPGRKRRGPSRARA